MSYEKLTEAAPYVVGAGIAGIVTYAICQEEKKKPEDRVKSTPIKGEDNLLPKQKIPKELMVPSDCSGVCFGKSQAYPAGYIGKSDTIDGHILVVGSTGSGKTTAIANPSLMSWKGSTISLFIKGCHEEYVDQRKAEGRKVMVFDPERMGNNLVRYDFFAPFGHEPENLVGVAMDMANMLLPILPETYDPIWTQAAQVYLAGSIIHFYQKELSFVDTLNMVTRRSVDEVAKMIMDGGNEKAISFISKLHDSEDRLKSSTGFNLLPLTQLLSPEMLEAFTPCEGCEVLDWQQLNTSTEPLDIVLVIPEEKLNQWGPMLGLMLSQLIHSLESRPERTYNKRELPPILIAVDEFTRLGKIPPIINGLNTLRSRGVTLLLLAQSVASIDQIYGSDARRIIMENCQYQIILSLADKESQEYFSKLVGTTATIEQSSSSSKSCNLSLDKAPVSVSYSKSQQYSRGRRSIIYPHEFRMLKDVICVTPFGAFQIKKRPRYLKNMKGKSAMDKKQLSSISSDGSKDERTSNTKVPSKKAKRSCTEYNQLYTEIGKALCALCPREFELWKSHGPGSENFPEEMLDSIQVFLKYANTHPRFVESLKSGLLH